MRPVKSGWKALYGTPPPVRNASATSGMTRVMSGNISTMLVRFRVDAPVRPAACSRGSRYVRSRDAYGTRPPQPMGASHSRTYRSLRPVFSAISTLVAAPIFAIASKRPTRRPTSSRTETAAPSRWRTMSWVNALAFARSNSASGIARFPLTDRSHCQVAAIHRELDPGDVGRLVRGQEQDRVGDLFHSPLALQRHRAQRLLPPRRIGGGLGGPHRRQDARLGGGDADCVAPGMHGPPS